MSCYCDYDPPEGYRQTHVKAARRPHRCSECGARIPIRAAYKHVVGKWDGQLSEFHMCLLCKELGEWAEISVPCFCWAFGHLLPDVRDMVEEISPTVPGFFFEYGRRKVKINKVRAAVEHGAR